MCVAEINYEAADIPPVCRWGL